MENKKSEFDPECMVKIDEDYLRSETSDWIKCQAIEYWHSLDETGKQRLLSVPAYTLGCFASDYLDHMWLRTLVVDAAVFFDLHGTWDVYVCPKPSCLRWFREEESLILHLKNKHFPKMQQINAWPLPQRDLAEEKWCVEALEKMVWEPVDVEAAVDMLSRVCLDHDNVSAADVCAIHDSLCSLEWPLSKDTARSELLAELRQLFECLKPGQASFSLFSNGLLRTVAALASKNILVDLPPGDNVHFLGVLLSNSPISFRFLDKNSLSTFVQLVRRIHQLVKTMQSPPKESNLNKGDIVNWKMSEIMDAVSFDCKNSTFILDQSKARSFCGGDMGGIPSWLSSAPCKPTIDQLPVEASEIYHKVENTFNCFIDSLHAFNMKFQEQKVLTSEELENQSLCSFLAPRQLLFLQTKEHLCQEEPNHGFINNPQFFSEPSWKSSWIKSFCELEPYCLNLVQSWCELLCLEPLVRRVCHLDFRMYIVPLLRSCFRMVLYADLKVRQRKKCPVEEEFLSDDYIDTESDDDYDSEAISGSDSEQKSEFEPEDSSNKGSKEGQFENSHHEADSKGEPETGLDTESELEDESWMDDELLSSLFSSLRESSALVAKSNGLFFCMELVDLMKFFSQTYPDSEYRIFWEGIAWFRLSKTFKYWCCFSCQDIFVDRESFTVHMDFKHQLCISDNEYWLVPASSRDMVKNELDKGQQCAPDSVSEETRKAWLHWCSYCCKKRFSVWSSENFWPDVVMDESVLEESIHLDNRCEYFLVDAKMQFSNEDQLQGNTHQSFMNIVKDVEDKYNQLRMHFKTKQQLLKRWEIFYSSCTLRPEDKTDLLLIQYSNEGKKRKLNTTFEAEFDKAYEKIKHELGPELERVNISIIEKLQQIESLKGNLLKFGVGDYRTKLFPYVTRFLNKRFPSYTSNLGYDIDRMLKEKLASLGPLDLMDKADDFEVELLSTGNVFINVAQDKSSWGFAYTRMKVKFSGKWSLTDHKAKIEGIFKFAGSSNWGPGASFRSQGKLVVLKNEPRASAKMNLAVLNLETSLHCAVGDKLVKFQEELEKMLV